MQFKITNNNNESFIIDENKLYEQLLLAVLDKNRQNEIKGGEQIVGTLANWLSTTGFIVKHDLISSLFLAFKLGFYFKSFLIKQTVEIIESQSLENKEI